ncbi:hypothetical protein CVV38_01275 [Candidatus Peregrinibacteria bacterium HGW-Peregrinibacteria-1]|jgi:ubiquinone/menaquinone biosynthesis C-methylase UbiE|nr:MAG: hypothetical protein CVV38_01275 [Candidatus Peregrinibacteria bacterium HGW-Peregrinibacteria-1]
MSFKGKIGRIFYEVEEGYDLYGANYDKSSKFLEGFEQGAFEKLTRDVSGGKALDLGCGTGRNIPKILDLGCEVVAADISETMLKFIGKKFPRIEKVKTDGLNMPFADNSFDLVVAMFLIVHLKDPADVFREVYRVLKPGGVFLLSNVNQRKPPKVETMSGESIVIESYYHRPEDVISKLEYEFFKIENDELVIEDRTWINQLVKARK